MSGDNISDSIKKEELMAPYDDMETDIVSRGNDELNTRVFPSCSLSWMHETIAITANMMVAP